MLQSVECIKFEALLVKKNKMFELFNIVNYHITTI